MLPGDAEDLAGRVDPAEAVVQPAADGVQQPGPEAQLLGVPAGRHGQLRGRGAGRRAHSRAAYPSLSNAAMAPRRPDGDTPGPGFYRATEAFLEITWGNETETVAGERERQGGCGSAAAWCGDPASAPRLQVRRGPWEAMGISALRSAGRRAARNAASGAFRPRPHRAALGLESPAGFEILFNSSGPGRTLRAGRRTRPRGQRCSWVSCTKRNQARGLLPALGVSLPFPHSPPKNTLSLLRNPPIAS